VLPVNDDVSLPLVIIFELSYDAFFLSIREHSYVLRQRDSHPFVGQYLFGGEALHRVLLEDSLEQGKRFFANFLFLICGLALKDLFVKLCHIASLEGYRAEKHGVKDHTCTPDVTRESFVTVVFEDFRSNVGWGTALLGHCLAKGYQFRDAEVAYFDITLGG
jgi:hypothetical protein